jgi:hypothetical protein
MLTLTLALTVAAVDVFAVSCSSEPCESARKVVAESVAGPPGTKVLDGSAAWACVHGASRGFRDFTGDEPVPPAWPPALSAQWREAMQACHARLNAKHDPGSLTREHMACDSDAGDFLWLHYLKLVDAKAVVVALVISPDDVIVQSYSATTPGGFVARGPLSSLGQLVSDARAGRAKKWDWVLVTDMKAPPPPPLVADFPGEDPATLGPVSTKKLARCEATRVELTVEPAEAALSKAVRQRWRTAFAGDAGSAPLTCQLRTQDIEFSMATPRRIARLTCGELTVTSTINRLQTKVPLDGLSAGLVKELASALCRKP